MNETQTRAELIDPKLKECGWGVVEGSKIHREFPITIGRIQSGGTRAKRLKADYVLEYKGIKLAVIEAKSDELEVGEGVAQAKLYAQKLEIETTYSTNGNDIYYICLKSSKEKPVDRFLTPDELWKKTYPSTNSGQGPLESSGEAPSRGNTTAEPVEAWRENFARIPFEDKSGTWQLRYYQEIAVRNTMEAIVNHKDRILLTLATGTGKTAIAFQIAWKLFHTRWNLTATGPASEYVSRRPRILFLADRNILADQAFNSFSAFPDDALVRIKPDEIRKKGKVPTNGSIFFTIFQTFMSGGSAGSPNDGVVGSPNGGVAGTLNEREKFEEIEIKEAGNVPCMYILECADGSFYTGSTKYLRNRIEQHKNGDGAEYTKLHLPVKLVYYETFDRIDKAFYREKQIKRWSRAKKIALIKNDIELLKKLSKNKTQYPEFSVPNDPEPKAPEPVEGCFGNYPKDYFDFIIIDECHRGGANDESNWRNILEYFSPAIQLGLTATPKRDVNVDTYRYFGDPVYIYSLKKGINDGFLTPFKVKRINTTIDEYVYTSDDHVVEGEIEAGKIYKEEDFNRIIEIREREAKRVKIYMDEANQKEKAIVFCATQIHAAAVRDLINQYKTSRETDYCVRVTANDGAIGEQFLRDFQDNEKLIPTILTTSQKLSTGVDARNIRNIALLRSINSIVEFKQIVGRGTRLYEGKDFFTIYDFVNAYQHFSDPEWDGEPLEPDNYPGNGSKKPDKSREPEEGYEPKERKKKIKVKLRNGKELEIQHMIATSFWSADGTPISAEEFLTNLFGELPNIFKNEDELRTLWSVPSTRKTLLEKLEEAGFGRDELNILRKLVDAEKSDLFDVLEYIFNSDIKPITREERVTATSEKIFSLLNDEQKEFIEFVLSKYIDTGFEELDQEKLPILLQNKYQSLEDAKEVLGNVPEISRLFIEFQKYLYECRTA